VWYWRHTICQSRHWLPMLLWAVKWVDSCSCCKCNILGLLFLFTDASVVLWMSMLMVSRMCQKICMIFYLGRMCRYCCRDNWKELEYYAVKFEIKIKSCLLNCQSWLWHSCSCDMLIPVAKSLQWRCACVSIVELGVTFAVVWRQSVC